MVENDGLDLFLLHDRNESELLQLDTLYILPSKTKPNRTSYNHICIYKCKYIYIHMHAELYKHLHIYICVPLTTIICVLIHIYASF